MSGGGDGNRAYGHTAFRRSRSHFTDRITADGRDGWPVAAGRYRLVVSRACPWASRAVISRRLLGLEDALSMAIADPIQDDRSWRFTLDPDGRDPVLGIRYLGEAYDKRETDYPGGVSVPAIVDVPSGELVTNDYQRLTLDLATEWTALHRPGAPDLYPDRLRDEIDTVMADVYKDVNNGVYRAGFASEQGEYGEACAGVFRRLELLTDRLARQRYLVGETITEADIRLFTTLVRFDAVYHGHFKCNRWKVTENQVLGHTSGTSSRRPASVTPSTSTTSSGTTTGCTPASTRPGSSPSAPTWPAGTPRTTARNSAAARSATVPRPARCAPTRRFPRGDGPETTRPTPSAQRREKE